MLQNRWVMLTVIFLVRTSMGFMFQGVASVAPLLVAEFGLSYGQIGLLMGLFLLPGVIIALPGGALGQRFGSEPIAAAARATLIVVTRADVAEQVESVVQRLREAVGPRPDPVQAVFRPEIIVSVRSGESRSLSWCVGKTALLCSGIGHSTSFRAMAEGLQLRVLDEVRYPDHHLYTKANIDRLRARAEELKVDLILTTEKDAGKVALFLTETDSEWWAVRLGTAVAVGEERLRQLILSKSTPVRVEACA